MFRERALATAAGPDDGDEFSLFNGQVESSQRHDLQVSAFVDLEQVAADGRMARCHSLTGRSDTGSESYPELVEGPKSASFPHSEYLLQLQLCGHPGQPETAETGYNGKDNVGYQQAVASR